MKGFAAAQRAWDNLCPEEPDERTEDERLADEEAEMEIKLEREKDRAETPTI